MQNRAAQEAMWTAVERLLDSGVEKPARYAGGEKNAAAKAEGSYAQHFAMCFADSYEVAMSHLGSRLLYGLMNERAETFCERCFAPWPDMEEKMRAEGIPLFGLESRTPLREFDLIGFSLQYEMCYTNLLNMLDLAGIPLRSMARGEDDPIVTAGGPCAVNPEPIAPFIDLFLIGDGEESLPELLDLHLTWKKEGGSREEFLRRAAQLEGCYVPAFYTPRYDEKQELMGMDVQEPAPSVVRRRIVEDFEHAYFPTNLVIPYTAAVHDRTMLELFRGCTRGCRFCQAGYIYRPIRERSVDMLETLAKRSIDDTGYEEMTLTSLSTGDYSQLGELIDALAPVCAERRVSLQLPSLRIDSFGGKTAAQLVGGRKGSLTFAPEAGTQRLRDVINKGVTEENLLTSVKNAFENGWNSVKLYFMIGLPTETDEDLDGIVDLAQKVVRAYYEVPKEIRNKGLRVSVSASTFVPKPCTPFQWEPQITVEEVQRRQRYLKDAFKGKKSIDFRHHGPHLSHLEAVFSKGDRRLADVLETAWKKGCKFDAWTEFFHAETWYEAFEECGMTTQSYANRRYDLDCVWPFSHIDMRVQPEYLRREWEKAVQEASTRDCRGQCNGCFDSDSRELYCRQMRAMTPINPDTPCG